MWTKENIPEQTGKTVIVTGANAGIGFETALALYEAGAHVVLACRDKNKAEKTIEILQKNGGKGVLEAGVLDLSSLSAVKQFAEAFKEKHSKLDLLINNAGVMVPPASKTADGYELQFGVNFLGHFALTGHLYSLLKQTAGSRIVTVSSLAYAYGVIDFDNFKLEKVYEPMREYSQSKLANLSFTVELQRRIEEKGDAVLSVGAHPGVTETELIRHMSDEEYQEAIQRLGPLMKTAQGALPTLFAAVSPEAKGSWFCGPDGEDGLKGYPAVIPIKENALDETTGRKLWEEAQEITGIVYP